MSEETTPMQVQQATPEGAPQAESFVMPAKFEGKSAEEIAKSYVELEKFKASQNPTPSQPEETPQAQPEEKAPMQIEKTEVPSLNQVIEDFSAKYVENGNRLTEEDYKALEGHGLSKGVVDQFIQGKTAEVASQQDAINKVLGEDKQEEIFKWAGENLSKAELDSLNRQLIDTPEIGAQMLKLRYEAEVPQSGQFLSGNGAPANVQDVFHSQQEVITAMSDPQYGQGGAYDLAIRAKIERTARAGTLK